MNIKDKVIVITGASSGLGREMAFQMAEKGAKVVLAARHSQALQEISDEIGTKGGVAFVCRTDVSKRNDMEHLAQAAFHQFGRLDIFIHNAGTSHRALDLTELDETDVRRVWETNFMGGVYSVCAAVPYLEKSGGGQLVFVTSVVGKRGIDQNSVYCASKFALQGLAESVRTELRDKNIRVTTICPAGIDTPFFQVNGREGERGYQLHPVKKIARLAIRAVQRETREALLTWDAKLLHYANVVLPSFVDYAVMKRKEL